MRLQLFSFESDEIANSIYSTNFSLVEFKEDTIGKNRKYESYEKDYLLGKYGAIIKFNKETIEKIKSQCDNVID